MLYNRYLSGAWPDAEPRAEETPQEPSVAAEPVFSDVSSTSSQQQTGKSKPPSALKGLFNGNIKLPEFDADTILLLVLVYFLVADDNENISDTLLIIGVLLLLGF